MKHPHRLAYRRIMLVISIIFSIFVKIISIMIKKFFSLYFLFCMVVCPVSSFATTIKVISYNIRNGEANDGTNSWKYRYPATILMLKDQNPDIFGVQEAYDYQADLIKDNLNNYKVVGVGREDGKKEGEHMSVFYNKKRLKLLKWGTFWLSETPDSPSLGWDAACRRTATWTLMKDKKTGRKFWFVNTHLDHVGAVARKEGLKLICDKIKDINKDNLPMILTGDFNVTPEDECLSSLDGIMINARTSAEKSTSEGSYNEWGAVNPPLAIDYIYYRGFDSCKSFEVITKEYYGRKFISDHFPVSATLEF